MAEKQLKMIGMKKYTSIALLVLAVVILVAVVITYLVLKMAERPQKPPVDVKEEVPMPVYENQLGNIRFVFLSSINRGGILRASEIKNDQYNSSYQKDFLGFYHANLINSAP